MLHTSSKVVYNNSKTNIRNSIQSWVAYPEMTMLAFSGFCVDLGVEWENVIDERSNSVISIQS